MEGAGFLLSLSYARSVLHPQWCAPTLPSLVRKLLKISKAANCRFASGMFWKVPLGSLAPQCSKVSNPCTGKFSFQRDFLTHLLTHSCTTLAGRLSGKQNHAHLVWETSCLPKNGEGWGAVSNRYWTHPKRCFRIHFVNHLEKDFDENGSVEVETKSIISSYMTVATTTARPCTNKELLCVGKCCAEEDGWCLNGG